MSDIEDTLGAAFRDIVDHILTDVHTAIPAQVVKYDNAAQTVDVQPMVKRVIVDEDGNELVESLPQITGVPVAFPSGGGYMVTFPIVANDYVMLVFSERPMDTWLSSGSESDPGDLRHHDLSDAVAIPCIRPTSGALADADASKMVVGKDGGPQLVIDGGGDSVSLYSKTDADFVARASLVDARIGAVESALNTFIGIYNAHIHVTSNAVVGAPVIVAPTVAVGTPMTPGQPTGSQKVKTT